jgi:hypothetical protein
MGAMSDQLRRRGRGLSGVVSAKAGIRACKDQNFARCAGGGRTVTPPDGRGGKPLLPAVLSLVEEALPPEVLAVVAGYAGPRPLGQHPSGP